MLLNILLKMLTNKLLIWEVKVTKAKLSWVLLTSILTKHSTICMLLKPQKQPPIKPLLLLTLKVQLRSTSLRESQLTSFQDATNKSTQQFLELSQFQLWLFREPSWIQATFWPGVIAQIKLWLLLLATSLILWVPLKTELFLQVASLSNDRAIYFQTRLYLKIGSPNQYYQDYC